MADPRGRESAGGSGICSNKKSKKMRKKIIGAEGGEKDNSQIMLQHCFSQKKGWERGKRCAGVQK